MTEFDGKRARMRSLLETHQLDALLLRRVSSFAWATCGGDAHVNTADSYGIASLLVTRAGHFLITNNIEALRLEQEEKLGDQQWEPRVTPWHESANAVTELTLGMKLGADAPYPGAVDLSGELARLRAGLTPEEGERFRALGRLCAEAMDAAIRAVRPGQSEYHIAGLLAREAELRGAPAIVKLVATDERIFRYRHPLPTAKTLERYAMLVLCARQKGLVASITRLVHFGRLPDELRRKAEAVAAVDAAMIANTVPRAKLCDILADAIEAYARAGFPDEWQLHHQGGPAGYEPREIVATLDTTDCVRAGQVYAWNPSITGTKSEDTVLVGERDNTVLTAIPGWPVIPVNVGGDIFERPAILEIV